MADGRTVAPSIATFLFEAANFVALAAALGWLFFRPVQDAIERRRAALEKERQDAEEVRAEAERRLEQAETRRREVEASLEPLWAEVREEAARQAAAVVAAAHAQADAMRGRLERELLALRRQHVQTLAHDAAAAARALVERLLADIAGPDLDAALTRAACQRLATQPATTRGGSVQVETAHPLAAEVRAAIVAAIGPGATVHERVVPDLGAGVRIITAAGLVDATAAGLGAWAERELVPRLLREGSAVG